MNHDKDTEIRMLPVYSLSMMGALVFFNGITLVVNSIQSSFINDRQLSNLLLLASLLITVSFIWAAVNMYRKQMLLLKNSLQSATARMVSLRAITIMHHALCEAPAVAGSIGFMLFGNPLFLVGVVAGLVEMIRKYPSREKIDAVLRSGLFNY